jgi:peroxiredoxin
VTSISLQSVPDFDLPGVDGRRHALADYANAEVLVLIQFCNHCPYVLAWQDRINAIAREYADRGVAVVAIGSNDAKTHPEDGFDAMVARSREEDFAFDYLYDEDQSLARALGSQRTPEVFVFDRDRRLVYHGAVDDDRSGDAISKHYLRDALDAALEGRAPEIADTPPVGCTVKWRN